MNGRGPVLCHAKDIGAPQQTIWIRRGSTNKREGAGPLGWKLRRARILSRSLAEMAIKFKPRPVYRVKLPEVQ